MLLHAVVHAVMLDNSYSEWGDYHWGVGKQYIYYSMMFTIHNSYHKRSFYCHNIIIYDETIRDRLTHQVNVIVCGPKPTANAAETLVRPNNMIIPFQLIRKFHRNNGLFSFSKYISIDHNNISREGKPFQLSLHCFQP